MSDELRLPDDLAACEAQLAAQSLPASGIDRDQLMYRAGWAACEAHLAAVHSPAFKVGSTRGFTLAWSLSSAAVAASLAVVLTLQWQPVANRDVAQRPTGSRQPLAVETAEIKKVEASRTEVKAALARTSSRKLDIGLLRMRRQALADAWAEPTSVAAIDGHAATPTAKTARELMGELLPVEDAGSTRIWPWMNSTSGDSI
jgi:hypothetical protein